MIDIHFHFCKLLIYLLGNISTLEFFIIFYFLSETRLQNLNVGK